MKSIKWSTVVCALSITFVFAESGPWTEYPVGAGWVRLAEGMPKSKPIKAYVVVGNEITTMYFKRGENENFNQFCHDAGIAQFRGIGDGRYGLTDAELTEAAQACGHPELAQAKAIRHGLSAQGRRAARSAQSAPEKVLCALLVHSYNHTEVWDQLPAMPEIPLFFQNTYDDLFQDHDRRMLSYNWCTNTFRDYQQPCTQIIENVENNHPYIETAGSLLAFIEYLKDLMEMRFPQTIPMDGSPWSMNPMKLEDGMVAVCDLAKEGERTYHTNASAYDWNDFPGDPFKDGNWWLPGPRTAKIWFDWVKDNGGTVVGEVALKSRLTVISRDVLPNSKQILLPVFDGIRKVNSGRYFDIRGRFMHTRQGIPDVLILR